MAQILIANSLVDGFVVFLTATGDWSNDIAAAAVAENDGDAEALLNTAQAAEAANRVIDPYLIAVDISGAEPRPTEYREYIRAHGPSISIPS